MLAFLATAVIGNATGSACRADEIRFQRIRTFDPVHGLPPDPRQDNSTGIGAGAGLGAQPDAGPGAAVNMDPSAGMSVGPTRLYPVDQNHRLPNPANSTSAVSAPDITNIVPGADTGVGFTPIPIIPLAPPAQEENATPAIPLVAPPGPPARPPLPVPNNNVVLPKIDNVQVKPALSWRMKAYKLAMESTNAGASTAPHPNKIFAATVQDALTALSQACLNSGLQVLGESVAAGQLGAGPDANTVGALGKFTALFVIKQTDQGHVLVVSAADPDRHGARNILLQDILNKAETILLSRGVL